ncbi:PH-like domain-containing protein [Jatrophihabitans sp. DSM 45814]
MNRIELVLTFAVLFALALLGLRTGWRNRGRRQSALPDLAAIPSTLGPDRVAELSGLYVGTTIATQWQNRVVVHSLGQRADSRARLTDDGVLIERQGSRSIFIPAGQLLDARLEPALAGKVVGRGGLLVLRWRHGDVELDTGLRADDKAGYPAWVRAINAGTDISTDARTRKDLHTDSDNEMNESGTKRG